MADQMELQGPQLSTDYYQPVFLNSFVKESRAAMAVIIGEVFSAVEILNKECGSTGMDQLKSSYKALDAILVFCVNRFCTGNEILLTECESRDTFINMSPQILDFLEKFRAARKEKGPQDKTDDKNWSETIKRGALTGITIITRLLDVIPKAWEREHGEPMPADILLKSITHKGIHPIIGVWKTLSPGPLKFFEDTITKPKSHSEIGVGHFRPECFDLYEFQPGVYGPVPSKSLLEEIKIGIGIFGTYASFPFVGHCPSDAAFDFDEKTKNLYRELLRISKKRNTNSPPSSTERPSSRRGGRSVLYKTVDWVCELAAEHWVPEYRMQCLKEKS